VTPTRARTSSSRVGGASALTGDNSCRGWSLGRHRTRLPSRTARDEGPDPVGRTRMQTASSTARPRSRSLPAHPRRRRRTSSDSPWAPISARRSRCRPSAISTFGPRSCAATTSIAGSSSPTPSSRRVTSASSAIMSAHPRRSRAGRSSACATDRYDPDADALGARAIRARPARLLDVDVVVQRWLGRTRVCAPRRSIRPSTERARPRRSRTPDDASPTTPSRSAAEVYF